MGAAGVVIIKFADGKSDDLTLQTGECGMLELVEKARPFPFCKALLARAAERQPRLWWVPLSNVLDTMLAVARDHVADDACVVYAGQAGSLWL